MDIYTSNAIDFKALRNSTGKTLKRDNKYFSKVNCLKINRFPVNYNVSEKDIQNKLKQIPAFKKLNINEDSLDIFIRNGPYLEDLLTFFLNKPDLDYDLIHTTFFPYLRSTNFWFINNSSNN